VRKNYGKLRKTQSLAKSWDIELARKLTEIEDGLAKNKRSTSKKTIGNRQSAIRTSSGSRDPAGLGKQR